MKRKLLFAFIVIIFVSCQQSIKYEYVEIGIKESIFGGTELDKKDGEIIRVKTDSIAYLMAYQRFCISEKVAKDMEEAYGASSTTPTDFQLIDEQGNDISLLIHFEKIDSLKADIRSRIFELKNSLKKSEEEEEEKKAEEIKKSGEELKRNRDQIQREIKSINEGVDFSGYRGTIDGLNMEIVIFGAWAKVISGAMNSGDGESIRLAKQLKSKVATIQTREFPILRKEYVKILANGLWAEDVYVYANGTGNRYINFTGGIFVTNQNKQDFHYEIQDNFLQFRFTQSRYRWYKEQNEYTYWKVYEGKDSDLVNV